MADDDLTPEQRLLRAIFGKPGPHPDHPCATDGCPGDGRYAPPGRGHVAGCKPVYRPAGGDS